MSAPAPVLWDVVEEHLDEAAFLYGRWEAALASPLHAIGAVAAGPEERLLAHVDGLAVAGAPARARLLEPAVSGEGGGDGERAFAAALALLEAPGSDGFDGVVAGLGRAPSVDAALGRALQLARRPGIERELADLAAAGAPARMGAALEALAFRRVPVAVELLLRAEATRAPAALAAALRAARWAGPRACALVDRGLRSPVLAVRDAAIESGLVLGLRSAWAGCQAAARGREPGAAFPLLALALGGDPADAERIAAAAGIDALRPAALFALGFAGSIAAAEVCLACVRDPKVARVAGEAFSAITGLELDEGFRAPEPPAPEEPVPLEQEDLDAELVPGPEAALPRPAAAALEDWWKGARARFDPRVRYLGGKPFDPAALQAALADGPTRRRHALALELAIRTRGEHALQTRGWAADQLRAQGERRPALRPEALGSFGKLMRE